MKIIVLISTVFFSLFANGQENLTKFLKSSKNAVIRIQGINPNSKLVQLEKELNCGYTKHNYITQGGDLFLKLDGSGKIFKYDTSSKSFIRFDNTCYEGYNFGSYDFTWKNKFYSFGGSGFWQYNGGLRYFDDQLKEWNVVPLEKEVPFSLDLNAAIWQDFYKNKIYVIYSPRNSSYVKTIQSEFVDSLLVQCLDLNQMKWWDAPKLINYRLHELADFKKSFSIYSGLIFQTTNSAVLFDFDKNEIAEINPALWGSILGICTKYPNTFTIHKDSTLFFYNKQNDSLLKVPLVKSQFIFTGKSLYQNIPKKGATDWIKMLLAISLIVISIVGAIFYTKQKRKTDIITKKLDYLKQEYVKFQEIKINNDGTFSSNLTDKELSVFGLLMEKTLQQEMVSIDDINNILGVKNKDLTIQNQLRSDVFQNINKKFKVYATTNDTLIERERTEFDKRVYQYRINERYLNKIK